MKRIISKIAQRNNQFKAHPITKTNRLRSLGRYIYFNFASKFASSQEIKWIGDLKFIAVKGDAGIVPNIYFGLHEFPESIFLLHFLRAEDTFLDIGANVGHYSLLAAGIKKAKSIAVEPVPSTFAKFQQQIALNKLENKITALNIGVGSEAGTLHFSTDKGTMNRVVTADYKNSAVVPIQTIDEVVALEPVNLIKIDVEGFEKFALQGASATLENPALKAVIIEINFSNSFYGVDNLEIVALLEAKGFSPYTYDGTIRKLTALESYNAEQYNTIFIRDLHFVEDRIAKSEKIAIWNTSF